MSISYTERHSPGASFSIEISRQLCSEQSRFQKIEIFDSDEFGRFLTLDGYMMLTERDEFIYHEMMVHVPMAVHPNPKNVLIIGGGDGGCVRELCRYPNIERIDLVEIDQRVIELCESFLPSVACSFNDPRLLIHYEDGLRYIRRFENTYDIILVDSTDPFGPGEGLFTREFYGNCHKALKTHGILVNQHESPFYSEDADACRKAHFNIFSAFPICKVYQAHIPTYPSGHWLFGFASKGLDPLADLHADEWEKLKLDTKYYNTRLHRGAFALPTYVNNLLKEAER